MHLGSLLGDVSSSEEQAAYREEIIQYVDSVFTARQPRSSCFRAQGWQGLGLKLIGAGPGSRGRRGRPYGESVMSNISRLLQNRQHFAAALDEEANFCTGATQVHTHSPTYVKYGDLETGEET